MAVNVRKTYTTSGPQVPVMLNRHGPSDYTLDIDIGGGGDVTVEATSGQINRGQTPIWHPLASLTNVTADAFEKVTDTPLEAVRLNITSVTDEITFQVSQNTY